MALHSLMEFTWPIEQQHSQIPGAHIKMKHLPFSTEFNLAQGCFRNLQRERDNEKNQLALKFNFWLIFMFHGIEKIQRNEYTRIDFRIRQHILILINN